MEAEKRRIAAIKEAAEKELRDAQKFYRKQIEELRKFGFNS